MLCAVYSLGGIGSSHTPFVNIASREAQEADGCCLHSQDIASLWGLGYGIGAASCFHCEPRSERALAQVVGLCCTNYPLSCMAVITTWKETCLRTMWVLCKGHSLQTLIA